jgi:hypothetical protein
MTKSNSSSQRQIPDEEIVSLAVQFGNIAQACRSLGVDRSVYYRALQKVRKNETVKSRSPLAKSLTLENKAIALCLEFPAWGCDRLAWYLTLKGDSVSSPTVQKILIRHGLGRTEQRRALAARLEEEGIKPAFSVP